MAANATELPYDQFNAALEYGKIYKDAKHPLDLLIEEGSSTQTLTGFHSNLTPGQGTPDQLQPFHTTISLDYDKDLQAKLKATGLTPNIRNKSNMLATTLVSFLPILIFLLILYFLFRQQIRMAGKGALNFGKSKARMMARDKNKITFKDVAGRG